MRPLIAVLAFTALLVAPWPAAASPSQPVFQLRDWLAGLWTDAARILSLEGSASADPVSSPTEGMIFDPNGKQGVVSTPPSGTDGSDAGLIFDPNG
jgi:hypothetical protein